MSVPVDELKGMQAAAEKDVQDDIRKSVDVTRAGKAHSHDDKFGEDEGERSLEKGEFDDSPTEEEKATLRRLPDRVQIASFLIGLVELAERFSYYGSQVVYQNYVQFPLPPGSSAGDGGAHGQSGAFGRGQRIGSAMNTLNTFWVYTIPLFGAYVADTRLGRFKTVSYAVAIAIVGHILLVISALPPVLKHPNGAFGCFIIAMLTMGLGTGAFKSNISPLVAEQSHGHARVVTLKSGERVILDPAVTSARIYSYFYLMINVGALGGQLGMAFAEKYVGYWLAFLLPTIMFLLSPIVLFIGRNKYKRTPPEGSVLADSMKLWLYCTKGRWSLNPWRTWKNFTADDFWTGNTPSAVIRREGSKPQWMTWNDSWVMEVRRGFKACQVFIFLPIWWLSYNQLTNNLISQAATMQTNGIPNEVISNLDPFALIILIPICEHFIYPALRKARVRVTPVRKIATGFFTGMVAMIVAMVIQIYIYRKDPCKKSASTCFDADGNLQVSPLNVWIQSPAYILIALSEIFASITTLEYAYTKAPKNMRSLVMSFGLFQNALSAAIGEGIVVLSNDPWLTWNYAIVAILNGCFGILFWICFRKLDREEERLNDLPSGTAHAFDPKYVGPTAADGFHGEK